jgi:hypothetical protein
MNSFLDSVTNIEFGQSIYADNIKLLIYHDNQSLFDLLEFDDDTIFLEPLLFAYFNQKSTCNFPIEQILFGYISPFRRPDKIRIVFNIDGVAYLPKIGYFKIENSITEAILYNKTNGFEIKNVDEIISYTFYEILTIDNGNFEILRFGIPLLDDYFERYVEDSLTNEKEKVSVSIFESGYLFLPYIEKSIEIIKKNLPDYYEKFKLTNRRIVIFYNPDVLSFVTKQIHGFIFLTTSQSNDEVFFVEELIHQGSHNILNSILYDNFVLFKINPEIHTLGSYIGNPLENRSILSTFHGLYTVAKRVEYFPVLLQKKIFKGKQLHEFQGRFCDQYRRFRTGFEQVDLNELFTESGESFYQEIDSMCFRILKKFEDTIYIFNMSNQPNEFSYEHFCILNHSRL